MSIENILNKAFAILYWLFNAHKFKSFELGAYINSPLHLNGTHNIEIEKKVYVGYKSWLAALPLTGESDCILKIGKGSAIGHFNHIYSTKSIIIEDYVLTADHVYISDNLHGYKNISKPIIRQPIIQNKIVIVGTGSWLGENVCVLGACIGRNCVIGSNSVVTKDIPDYCVAVGAPAKIVKRYCFETQTWKKTNPDGTFID